MIEESGRKNLTQDIMSTMTQMPPLYQFTDTDGNDVDPSIIDLELRRLYHATLDDKYKFSAAFYELIRVAFYAYESGEFDKYRFFDAFSHRNVSVSKMRDFYILLRKKYIFSILR